MSESVDPDCDAAAAAHRRDPPPLIQIGADIAGDLAPLVFEAGSGAWPVTPASLTALSAIATHCGLLRGTGIDWGAGNGCLAIASARIASVERVVGLELSESALAVARNNARRNGVAARLELVRGDSFLPFDERGRALLESLRDRVDFLLANPPASDGDDGFGFRRRVLREARPFLREGAVVFLSASRQYGERRLRGLLDEVPGYAYGGRLASSGWVPFDLERPDLLRCLELYAAEERRAGVPYEFAGASDGETRPGIDAREALRAYRRTGRSPLSKWEVHSFRHEP